MDTNFGALMAHDEIQEFLSRHVGYCKECRHPMKRIVSVHRANKDGEIIFPSGLFLIDTHWSIGGIDEGESLSVGCTECERNSMEMDCSAG